MRVFKHITDNTQCHNIVENQYQCNVISSSSQVRIGTRNNIDSLFSGRFEKRNWILVVRILFQTQHWHPRKIYQHNIVDKCDNHFQWTVISITVQSESGTKNCTGFLFPVSSLKSETSSGCQYLFWKYETEFWSLVSCFNTTLGPATNFCYHYPTAETEV